MLRSLFSGISGLRAHQQMMDVTGNNIANVNTTGFKSSQAVFEDTLSQLIKASGAPQSGNGGTNPAQIGLGVRMAGINTSFSQGSSQTTGRSTDLMISGDGFFMVTNNGVPLYTRAGAFSFDANGRLVNSTGMVVQGWTASNGKVDTNSEPADVVLPTGTLLPPTATKNVVLAGNLPADMTSTTPLTQSVTTYDGQGNAVVITSSFTKVDATHWSLGLTDGTTTATPVTITFDATGASPSPTTATINGITVSFSGLTDYAGKATVGPQSQDGYAMGALTGFTIGEDGLVIGTFSNGLKQNVAQIALATFNNPGGLEKVGNSTYRESVNSGIAQFGQAGSGSRGLLQGGSLEMSNVDLGQEFTNLIIAQRGFQANSKVISTSDELLQDLVNLKR